MDKKIFSFVVILSWCLCFVPTNQGLYAQAVSAENSRLEQEITSEGGGGLELNLPYGYGDFIPGVTAKVSLPLELHPWENPSVQDVATAIKLYWSNRLQVYGGNVSFGGPTSLFTTAAPTMTVNPLAAFSFPAASVTVGLPGFNGSSAVYGGAVVASLGKGFAKDRISLWATGSQQKRFFGGLAVPLTLGEVQLQFSSAVGVWFLEDQLFDWEDEWYGKELPYHGMWLKGLALEGRLTWNWIKLYGGAVMVEQPWGGFGYWGRLRFYLDVPVRNFPLQVLGGISGGLPDSITASGSRLRESFQSYINPQFTWDLREKFAGLRLKVGLAFGANVKNTDEDRPQLFSDGKLRGGLELQFPLWRLQLVGDWLGIRLHNPSVKESLRSQEKYGGTVKFTLSGGIPRFSLGLQGSGHYERGASVSKDRIVAAGSVSIMPKEIGRTLLFSLVPQMTASTEMIFSPVQGFHSATTEAKASWNMDFPLVKVGIWVALELKHTTQ